MKRDYLCFNLLICLLFPLCVLAQPGYTANNTVKPYPHGFHPGANNGYYPGWTNEQISDLASNAGARAIRIGFTEEIGELFGYDILLNLFELYKKQGMKEHTVILSGPIDWHRDSVNYCPQARSALFKNLYQPIWDGGANGTPYNDENYFAAYVYKMATTYKSYVRYWEIWNEPGFDLTGSTGWLSPGYPKNWWENNPEPCDYILHAPVQHYIRTLRVAWEVIKTVDPDAYVTCSGVGYPAFLDAVLRQTDNPNGGQVTADYPLRGGAYFDAVGFHSYPHFDGSVRYWDNACNCMVNARHSDGAVDGMLRNQGIYQDVLNKHGYNGATFPKKIWTITEGNLPGKPFAWGNDLLLGGLVVQCNYIMKTVVRLMQNNIQQFDLFQVFDQKTLAEATEPFEVMGLYNRPTAPGVVPLRTPEGFAYQSTALHLFGTTYDAARTQAMQLPANVGGGAFLAPNGKYIYMLWAKTQTDFSESAAATYSFPAAMGLSVLSRRSWEFSYNPITTPSAPSNITFDAAPIFLTEDATWAVPVPDNRPKIDLELSLKAGQSNPAAGQNATFQLTIANKGAVRATNVQIINFLEFNKQYLLDRMRYVSHNAPSGTQHNPQTGTWTIPAVEAGQSLTLEITAKVLNPGPYRAFAQVGAADQPDADSKPLNGQVVKTPYEDDEADVIINDNNGFINTKADLVVETTILPASVAAGQAFNTRFMVRNNGRASANASFVHYALSADSLWSAEDADLGSNAVAALFPYAYETQNRTLAIPAGTPGGRYFLLYRCDDLNGTDEFDENNVFARPIRVINNTLVTDIAIKIVSAPKSLRPDQSATAVVEIQNIGNEDIKVGTNLLLSLSADAVRSADDLLLHADYNGGLSVGQTVTLTWPFKVPLSFTKSGKLQLLAIADAQNILIENNESNNTAAQSIGIQLYVPPIRCRKTYGPGSILCTENFVSGMIVLYKQENNTYTRVALDTAGNMVSTSAPQPLVFDSILLKNGQIIKKAANGALVFQKNIPAGILSKYPNIEAAAQLSDGSFALAGFQKYYDPQGIQPLHRDSLVLIRTDANLNLVVAAVVKRNFSQIKNDRVHALIPTANGNFTILYSYEQEAWIIKPFLTIARYNALLQPLQPEKSYSGYHLQGLTQTPCGDWKLQVGVSEASQKSSELGSAIYHFDAETAQFSTGFYVGTGFLDYFGGYKNYNFKQPLDSLFAGFQVLRLADSLGNMQVQYLLSNNTKATVEVPFLQFQHLVSNPVKGPLFLGIENDSIWGYRLDCNVLVGSEEAENAGQMPDIYPNPATQRLVIQLDSRSGGFQVMLTDVQGKTLITQDEQGATTEIDVSKLISGTYFAVIKSGGQQWTRKVVVLR